MRIGHYIGEMGLKIPVLNKYVRRAQTRLRKRRERPFQGSKVVQPPSTFVLDNVYPRFEGNSDVYLDLPWCNPLNVVEDEKLVAHPRINLLLPSLSLEKMTGGPNTALIVAGALSNAGYPVRLVATSLAIPTRVGIAEYVAELSDCPGLAKPGVLEIADASDRKRPFAVGRNDLFLATAWWTAQMAKYAVRVTNYSRFIYLIQDFEPLLHSASVEFALCQETYSLDYIPFINSQMLKDFFVREKIGRFADSDFAEHAIAFDPAIPSKNFFYDRKGNRQKRRLLFYARPNIGHRNLFQLGLIALKRLVADGRLDPKQWDIISFGEDLPTIELGNGARLISLPWAGYDNYAENLRTADVVLSLMLSPHPSYPPLEAAASNAFVVTNIHSKKTAEKLRSISPRLLAAEPTYEDIEKKLVLAMRMAEQFPNEETEFRLPRNWNDALIAVLPKLTSEIEKTRCRPTQNQRQFLPYRKPEEKSSTELHKYLDRRLAERRRTIQTKQIPGLLSLVTTVWNTKTKYIDELAQSVFLQDGGTEFEWLILDNGSNEPSTQECLKRLAFNPCVKLHRVEKNLGIIGGMKFCLENAKGRYILPVDSDDLLVPDAINVITHYLHEWQYPPILYTDEDKLEGNQHRDAYFKPDWDPVLLINSCYIAHLCVIEREKGLKLGLYEHTDAEGCHDWDSFIKFLTAGYTPKHIPEILYSWRMHEQSTAGNVASKEYISHSHEHTLRRFLDSRSAKNVELVQSPLFHYGVDRWFRNNRASVPNVHSIRIVDSSSLETRDHEQETAESLVGDLHSLVSLAQELDCEYLAICWSKVVPDSDEWVWEAATLFELFPETVMVGGLVTNDKNVVDGPRVLGFADGFGCPDRGRSVSDPGFFARLWKPHSVSIVSSSLCVIKRGFLLEHATTLIDENVELSMIGPWLGALATEQNHRVVYSPFVKGATTGESPEENTSELQVNQFNSRFMHLLGIDPNYHKALGLCRDDAYQIGSFTASQTHITTLQSKALKSERAEHHEISRRANRYCFSGRLAPVSLLTTIYERIDVDLFSELVKSIRSQTVLFQEWVIVAHGPIEPAKIHRIKSLVDGLNAKLIIRNQSLGIMGGMKLALDESIGDYIVPIDADDLITADAIQVLISEAESRNQPDMLFSDEDLLMTAGRCHPFRRGEFDPVLNADSSYVWHLCMIRRSVAVQLELYTDSDATWCHDWDSITRISNAGGRIEHIPEVLYHWRHHKESTSNKDGESSLSLQSVRHVLQSRISRLSSHAKYKVSEWPLNRGAKEFYIARKEKPSGGWLTVSDLDASLLHNAVKAGEPIAHVSLHLALDEESTRSEVVRLFDIHPKLGAIGGRVINENNVVVESCYVRDGIRNRDLFAGMDARDPGYYAMALKAQCVYAPGNSLVFLSARALQDAKVVPLHSGKIIADWLEYAFQALREKGYLIAYSPLVQAKLRN